MNNEQYIQVINQAIDEACSWVAAKKGCRVSVQEHWVDWEKKIFSPAFCCIWYYCAKDNLTFNVPDSTQWKVLFTCYLNEKLQADSNFSQMYFWDQISCSFIYLPEACYFYRIKKIRFSFEISQLLNDSPKISAQSNDYRFFNKDHWINQVISYLHEKYPPIFQPKRSFNRTSTANKEILLQKLAEVVMELHAIIPEEDYSYQAPDFKKDFCNDKFTEIPRNKFVAYTHCDGLIATGDKMSDVLQQVKEKGKMAVAHFDFWE